MYSIFTPLHCKYGTRHSLSLVTLTLPSLFYIDVLFIDNNIYLMIYAGYGESRAWKMFNLHSFQIIFKCLIYFKLAEVPGVARVFFAHGACNAQRI